MAECLAHIGLVSDAVVHPALGSERIFEYRNKMEFSCSDGRWRLPGEMGQEGLDINLPGLWRAWNL